VPVLKIDNADGHIRAIVFGYACHGTTLGGEYNLSGWDLFLMCAGAESTKRSQIRIHAEARYSL
jgi:hypothetical protein